MPKQVPDSLSEDLLLFLSAHVEGVGIDEITERFRPVASKRTLQRRLTALIAAGKVSTSGEARAFRYRTPQAITGSEALQAQPATVSGMAEIYPPLSPAAADVRALITQPTNQRKPVGYNRDFLDEYRPNETTWLAPEVLAHLRRVGEAPNADHAAAGTYARSILNRLLVDLSWASSKLEGNTYSLLETQRLIELGEPPPGKAALETQMILNHKAAIEMIVEGATGPDIAVNAYTIRNLHALLANNLLPDPAAGGRLRPSGVGIGGSVYLPLDGGPVLAEAFSRLIDTAAAIRDPFEQAFFLMVQLPYLQPFEDVNKRVSRLAANIPLIKQNLCPLSFVDVPQQPYIDGLLAVYELNRIELLRDVFIWAYERSAQRYTAVRQSLGQPDVFRLRYREQMVSIVRGIVLRGEQPTPEQISTAAQEQGVRSEDLDHFVRLVQGELNALHEGNFARFRLRPSEFEAWRASRKA